MLFASASRYPLLFRLGLGDGIANTTAFSQDSVNSLLQFYQHKPTRDLLYTYRRDCLFDILL
jgi:hypothetical protein